MTNIRMGELMQGQPPKEIRKITQADLNAKKAPGYELITERIARKKHCPSNSHMQFNYQNRTLSSSMEICADNNESETWQTARRSQFIQTDHITGKKEHNLRKSYVKEITPDIS
jgi:hypothetical protein